MLDRRLPEDVAAGPLTVKHGEAVLTLTREWALVLRRKVRERWGDTDGMFRQTVHLVVFEELAEQVGAAAFNRMVGELVGFDYYGAWVG